MFQFQSQMIFPVHAVPTAGPWPVGAERLTVNTPDGETLQLHKGIRPQVYARDDPRTRRDEALPVALEALLKKLGQ